MTKTLDRFRRVFAAAALCAAGAIASIPGAQAQTQKVTLGWTSADALYGPWFYAQDKGYFKKHDLDSTLIFFDSGTKGVQALISGGVDVLCADAGALMNARFAGFDGVFVGTTMGVLTGSVYASKAITKPAELKGARWGISSFGSEAHVASRIALASFKLDPKDVTIVQLGNQGNRLAALDAGQIQATTFLPPLSRRVENAGYVKLADLPDLAPDYFSVGPAVSKSFLNSKRDVVTRTLTALSEATAAYKKDRAGGAAVIQKYLKIDDIKDAEYAYDYYARLHPIDQRPSPKSFDIHLRNSTDAKAKTATIADFFDATVLDEIEKTGLFKKLQ